MAEPGGPLRLRDWLVAQIESGSYPGLRWENREKTMFRIPWKHAAKQDYREQQDAALFRAWAIYKGKYQEGTDKADPSVWKTRLRCALNKSTSFQEVIDRSQLYISEPYKVYQITSKGTCNLEDEGQKGHLKTHKDLLTEPLQQPDQADSDSDEETGKERISKGCHQVSPASCFTSPKAESDYQVTGTFYSWDPSQSHLPLSLTSYENVSTSELRRHLCLGEPAPQYQIQLCFGEEYPGPAGQSRGRLIMAHVEPVFARELFLRSRRLSPQGPPGSQPSAPENVARIRNQPSQP
ncbi:interferon regulatory factor 4-like isoform X2 [Antechinus flavipes]|uniref:interferon regulatory factor 4-like isoform X2 n=1 Tax=Antechinus flavipes TaxID=38775 RepID=UPI00223637E3|nr:interferon regulatory factor 4-like isoform X2 [Antechinus flavipes]